MQITVTGHHVEVTDALRDYTIQKLEKIGRHFDKISNIHAVLTVEKLTQKAEATIHLAGKEIFAVASDSDMYAAIDALSNKLIRQVEKHKDKTRH